MAETAFKTSFERLKEWSGDIRKELKALRIALAENLVPWYAKALIILTVGYALSPIYLIPDFIPLLGLLDDLIIIPLLIFAIIKLIPKDTMQYCRKKAETLQFSNKQNWFFGLLIIFFWLILAIWLAYILIK